MNNEFLRKPLFAHRGYFNNVDIPENSIPAFKKAIRYGYNIELDVHLTKDKKIVVFHDFNLKRMCKINKKIEDVTYDELIKYNLLDTKYKIPLLSEVLNLIDGKVGLLIETKVLKNNGKLEELLSNYLDNYNGEFAIQSFNVYSIYWFKKHRKKYLRGLLSSDFKTFNISNLKKLIGKTLLMDIILKTDFISYDIRALPNKYVENKKNKKVILGWTVRTKEEYLKYNKYCDNLICENMNLY